MAFDKLRSSIVLFGGSVNGRDSDETWTWNGSAWTQQPFGGPGPRRYFSCAYDALRGVTVLMGGTGDFGVPFLGDTWELALPACVQPSVAPSQQPVPVTVCPSTAAIFSIAPSGTTPT
ncbi:MAG: hypothetical protein ACK58T_36850, partial [Phycisphaerae bacterium]